MSQPTLVVIDPSVEDYEILLAGVRPDAWAAVLQPGRDGVVQITALLQALPNIRSLHVLAHGSAGALYLGNSEFSLATLDRYASELTTWFVPSPYQDSSTLHFYGCSLADGLNGVAFMTQIHGLTGATVYASKTKVGSAVLGGSWQLDAIAPPAQDVNLPQARCHCSVDEIQQSLPLHSSVLTVYPSVLMADTDGDGIDDAVDLDDDNDGILDTIEAANALQNLLAQAARPFRVSGTFQTASGAENQTLGSIALYTLVDEVGGATGYLRATVTDIVSNTGITTIRWGTLDGQPRVSVQSRDGNLSDTESATVRFEFYDLDSNVDILLSGGDGNRAEAVFTAIIGDLDDNSGLRRESVAAPLESITGYTLDQQTILDVSTTELPGFVLATGTANDPGDVIIPPDSIRFNYVQRSEFTLQLRTTNGNAGFQIDLRNALLYPSPETTAFFGADSDGDRLNDSVDLDSDNDGIPDNIEAQTTRGYRAPVGNDADGNGLDDAYETTPGSGEGLVPIDSDGSRTDGSGTQSLPNYLDNDSDDDGVPDVEENGVDALVTADDTDGDGLLDVFEGGNVNDGFDANDEIDSPFNGILPDSDGDATAGSSLSSGLDYLDNNTLPIAQDNGVSLAEDTTLSGNVITDDDPTAGRDRDADADPLTVTGARVDVNGDGVEDTLPLGMATEISAGGTRLGNLTLESTGAYTFTPFEHINGAIPAVTYTLSDGVGTDTAVLAITVEPVNDVPVISSGTITVEEERPSNSLGLILPTDADGDALTVAIGRLPSLGTVTRADGTPLTVGQVIAPAELSGLQYNAPEEYDGASDPGDFTYTVTDGISTVTGTVDITVIAVNDAPVVSNAAIAADEESTGIGLGLTAPTDAEGEALTIIVTGLPTLGQVTRADGTPLAEGQVLTPAELEGLRYDAPADYDGVADPGTFSYSVTDDAITVTGTATVTLTAINDVPDLGEPAAIAAVEESLGTAIGLAAPTDADGDPLTITVTELPALGTVTRADGTPLTEGQTLTPAALAGLIYNAPADYDGTSDPGDFTYSVTDGIATLTSRVDIALDAVDDVPIASSSALTVLEESADTSLGLTAPTDADGEPLTLTVTELPTLGQITLADGTPITVGPLTPTELTGLLYNAPTEYDGAADPGQFVYSVTDGNSTVTGTTTLTVIAVNDRPILGEASLLTALEESRQIPLGLAVPTDADGDALTVTITRVPDLGRVTLPNGMPVRLGQTLNPSQIVNLQYDAPLDYNDGRDPGEFAYSVTDGTVTVTSGVDITLIPINDAPIAVDDAYTAVEDVPLIVGAIAGVLSASENSGNINTDSDADGDPLRVIPLTQTTRQGGTVILLADGGFTYTAAPNYSGPDSFTYEVVDGNGGSDIGTVTLTVRSDADGDGIPDAQDADDDNDGIPDSVEQGDDPARDTDGDGLIDSLDLDADGDGIFDRLEAGYGSVDGNGDGRLDGNRADFGTNGLLDRLETAPDSGAIAAAPVDTDRDGVADFRDLDSDNDGINDVEEGGGRDADGNGLVDGPDADGDGVSDVVRQGTPPPDTDGDNRPDFQDLDADNDGVPDLIESGVDPAQDPDSNGAIDKPDSDGDGISDPLDARPGFGDGLSDLPLDSDNDGIPDFQEQDSNDDGIADRLVFKLATGPGTPDADGDGRVDDPTDSDGDGIPDAIDSQPGRFGGFEDSDGDGIADDLDLDDDNDGILDVIEQGGDLLRDTDGDGLLDSLDTDADGDGLFDVVEAGHGLVDANNDGRIDGPPESFGTDGLAPGFAGIAFIPVDTDGDRRPDFQDLDSDNDGINDLVEGGGLDADGDGLADEPPLPPIRDTDGDRRPDFQDLDSDNDGIPDVVEAGIPLAADADGNGVVDGPDQDNDGIPDAVDARPNTFGDGNPTPRPDTDGDGIPDGQDLDRDGDGVSDRAEAGLSIGSADADGNGQVDDPTDADADGIPDAIDSQPGRFGGFEDSDGDNVIDAVDQDDDNDGIPDEVENQGNSNRDTDGDGILDRLDLDADNDGILDLTEGNSGLDPDPDPDGDGRLSGPVGHNGLIDVLETTPDSDRRSTPPPDSDGDGIFDFQDPDSDNDGIADVTEAGGADPDRDGVIGQGPVRVTPNGLTPSGILQPPDQDGDGQANYRDTDSDNDGLFDLQEVAGGIPDRNNDGRLDGSDGDGDGILDVIDAAVGVPGTTPFSFAVPEDANSNGIPDFLELPQQRRQSAQSPRPATNGDDIINGFSDPDRLSGGAGNDVLNGGSDADQLVGGADNDVLNGGSNGDRLRGGGGNDILNAGGGDDILLGHSGRDVLNGGSGSDRLRGGAGRDILNGGSDRDRLLGDRGRDTLRGSRGDDVLMGGTGRDTLTGGQGSDRFAYSRINEFGDAITDFEILKDRIDLRQVRSVRTMDDIALGQRGNDAIVRAAVGDGFRTLAVLEDVNADRLEVSHFRF
ncbi:MAG: tandem-95 repeat protein [Elainellaceae cyanobacterium]